MVYYAFPIFLLMFLIGAAIYKYEAIGGLFESDNNYQKAQEKIHNKWEEREKIRLDKKKKEELLDKLKKR